MLKGRLEEIVKAEGMVCEDGVIDEVIYTSQGDMRKAITLLQSAYHLKGTEAVTGQDVLEIAGVSYLLCTISKLSTVMSNSQGGAYYFH